MINTNIIIQDGIYVIFGIEFLMFAAVAPFVNLRVCTYTHDAFRSPE